MAWVTLAGVYLVFWWLTFLAVLPWGIRHAEAPEAGHDPGAPANPALWRRAAATSLVAMAPTALVYWLVTSGAVTLDQLDWTQWFR